MPVMSKRKSGGEPGKRYPSRDRIKYVGIPVEMYAVLEEFARRDGNDPRSVSWAARLMLREILTAKGLWPPPPPPA